MTTHQHVVVFSTSQKTVGIAQSPFHGLLALGVGDVVAVAVGANGYVAAEGVVGALHEIGGFEHGFTLDFELLKQSLAVFQTSH